MSPDYLKDRIPVTPIGLVVGDRILAVHTEGEAEEVVDLTVTTKTVERDENTPFSEATVEIRYGDGENDKRKFKDAQVWLSVVFPRGAAWPARAAEFDDAGETTEAAEPVEIGTAA